MKLPFRLVPHFVGSPNFNWTIIRMKPRRLRTRPCTIVRAEDAGAPLTLTGTCSNPKGAFEDVQWDLQDP